MIIHNGIALIDGDSHVSKWVKETGKLSHDVWLMERLREYVHEGDTVVDAGANIGSHTAAYLEWVGDTGIVLAFEPNPEACECMFFNCPRATLFRSGLSDHKGWATLVPSGANAGAMSLKDEHSWNPAPTGDRAVRVWPLDDFALEALHYLKADVEGMEVKLLKGAEETIVIHRPVMCIEVNVSALARQDAVPEDIYTFLRLHNYSFKPIAPELTLESEQFDMICQPQ